jgi:uncharacterized protein YjbI with pentapeptide repeats
MADDDRTKALAAELLAALEQPDSAERAAYEQEKEAQDRAGLEDYYRRTGQATDATPRARTTTEMLFAASLVPCPHCQTTEPARLDLFGGGEYWSLTGHCARCQAKRVFGWNTEGHPNQGAVPMGQLGDARPSQIIRVGQLMAELDRLLPIACEPAGLAPADWRASLAAILRAHTCLHELLKFVPAGMQIIPDTRLTDDERADRAARRERYRKPWLEGELDRLRALCDRYREDAPRIWALEEPPAPRRGAIDRASLEAHEAWLRAGRAGPGRLEVAGCDARGLRLAGVRFEAARLERVTLDGALLEAARMMEAELRDLSAVGARCSSIDLTRATIVGGSFEHAVMPLAVFDGATIDRVSFAGAVLDRTTWQGAEVSGASFEVAAFANVRLDGGRFRACDLRRADFRIGPAGIMATSAGAVFEDCDLRGSRWDGHDLSGASFVRCRMHGVSGRPSALAGLTIEAPDLSPGGDGSNIAAAGDLLALWS